MRAAAKWMAQATPMYQTKSHVMVREGEEFSRFDTGPDSATERRSE